MEKINVAESFLKRIQNRYRLVISNDDTFEELIAFKVTRTSVYLWCSFLFIFLVGLTFALIFFTPLKYYIPGYGNKQSATELRLLKIRTDSLEQTIAAKEQYVTDIKKVLENGALLPKDTNALKQKDAPIVQKENKNNEDEKPRKRRRKKHSD
jgi:hypothetical protein